MFHSRHQGNSTPALNTFGDFIFYAYSNLQMLMFALKNGKTKFDRSCYMMRAYNFKRLRDGSRKIHDLYINNVWKMEAGQCCFYCGSSEGELSVDHIFPRSKNGTDTIDNVVLSCQSCNSSKGDLDLLEWYSVRLKGWPLPYIFAYYLKHVYLYTLKNELLSKTSDEIDNMSLPFKYEYIPLSYPNSYLEFLQCNSDSTSNNTTDTDLDNK